MLVRQVSHITGKTDIKLTKCLNGVLTRFLCLKLDDTPVKRQERKLREWRKMPDRSPKTFLGMWDKSTLEPQAKKDTSFHDPEDNKGDMDYSIANLKHILAQTKLDYAIDQQKYIPERLEILGSDLGAAHFLLYRGGKVKFRSETEWREGEATIMDLPNVFDARYILSAIDCSGLELYYEGMLNFENLTRVKWASFKGNPVLNEWCLDRIVGQMPCLEYLDVSECPKLDERGLEALYKLFRLKTLIVTNHHKSPALELTCMMLEDCNPNLECQVLQPGERPKEVSHTENE